MTAALAALAMVVSPSFAANPQGSELAIVGVTLIDGNGGEPVSDAVVLVRDDRIAAVGRRGRVEIPAGARVIDGSGRFLLPGFIDTNVHLSLYGGNTNERYESLVRYEDRQADIVLEASQLQLKYGVTTVRDSYGVLPPLIQVRDAIARGDAVGARMLVAGNIVGWGGPFSLTFSLIPQDRLTLFQERMNDMIAQGAGEDLMDMNPERLAVAIDAYLDKGPDFIKYGGTAHFETPSLIGFSPAQQRAMVERAHERGRMIETHATSAEGLRLAVEAGIDLIQHPEILTGGIPDELVAAIVDRDVICSMLVNTMTGPPWQEHLQEVEAVRERLADQGDAMTGHQGNERARERSDAERLRETWSLDPRGLTERRANALKLIAAGCTVTVGTDNYRAAAPEFARGPKPETQDHGIGTILAIEGLVELGLTPGEAIVAATRNGARAAGMLDEVGTIEEGKIADLLLLSADPLVDISAIRQLDAVVRAGREIDLDALPTSPVYYRH